jgi:hypothetical protein
MLSTSVAVSSPPRAASGESVLQGGQLIICKDTPPGTSGVFQIDAYFDDGSGRSMGIWINSGECQVITHVEVDPSILVHENEGNGPPGWHLASVTRITDAGGTEELSGQYVGTGYPVSCSIDFTHGCILIFHNVPNTPPCTDQTATTTADRCRVPPGKVFAIGPSSMEGHLKITAGTWFNGGYSFSSSAVRTSTQFTVNAKVEVTVSCPYGGDRAVRS